MNITDRLLKQDPTLKRYNEGLWQEPYNSEMYGFTSFNDAGIECETGEFLYGLVRLLKPNHILETGTHWGIGASYLGMALKDNRRGLLDTVEFLPEIYDRAQLRLLHALRLELYIKMHLMDVRKFVPVGSKYRLVFLDTEPQTRFEELLKFYPYVEEGGFIFIHDLHHHMHQIENKEHGFAWPFGVIPTEIEQLVHDRKLRPFHFKTPRGLTGFYKVSKHDYKW